MAYATEAKVEALIAQVAIDGSTRLTSTQLGLIIADVDAELDAILAGKGLTVPVTTPSTFLAYLVGASSHGVAARALTSLFMGRGFSDAVATAVGLYEATYERALKGLADGTLIPDALLEGSTGGQSATVLTVTGDDIDDLDDDAGSAFRWEGRNKW